MRPRFGVEPPSCLSSTCELMPPILDGCGSEWVNTTKALQRGLVERSSLKRRVNLKEGSFSPENPTRPTVPVTRQTKLPDDCEEGVDELTDCRDLGKVCFSTQSS